MTIQRYLYTFGYEGLPIGDFIGALLANNVQTIVDVRELPLSRKKGFSKSAFSCALSAVGIAYLHMPSLGCPKPIRDNYRNDQDWTKYTRAFVSHLTSQEAALRELAKLSRSTNACLICFEADYSMCHRTYVARATAAYGGPPVLHLEARTKTAIPDQPLRVAA